MSLKNNTRMIGFIFILLTIPLFASSALDIELGSFTNSYNRVGIPGDDGTRFDFQPSVDGHYFYYRLQYLNYFHKNHGLRVLYAPLDVSGEKRFSKVINFKGEVFSANEETKTRYVFNSYRASYFYQLIRKEHLLLNLGVTLKVRDAKVQLKQGDKSKEENNLGAVPLFYLYSEYRWNGGWRLAFDLDTLASPQGRAIDAALMGGYYFSKDLHMNLGHRVLEGGADNDKVFSFAQFNYIFSSLQWSF